MYGNLQPQTAADQRPNANMNEFFITENDEFSNPCEYRRNNDQCVKVIQTTPIDFSQSDHFK